MTISFHIELDHAPCPHQAGVRVSGHRVFKSERLRAYEEEIATEAWVARAKVGGIDVMDAPIRCALIFGYPGQQYADLENVEKSTIDSLETILFTNDKQICEKHSWRTKSPKGIWTIDIHLTYLDALPTSEDVARRAIQAIQ